MQEMCWYKKCVIHVVNVLNFMLRHLRVCGSLRPQRKIKPCEPLDASRTRQKRPNQQNSKYANNDKKDRTNKTANMQIMTYTNFSGCVPKNLTITHFSHHPAAITTSKRKCQINQSFSHHQHSPTNPHQSPSASCAPTSCAPTSCAPTNHKACPVATSGCPIIDL